MVRSSLVARVCSGHGDPCEYSQNPCPVLGRFLRIFTLLLKDSKKAKHGPTIHMTLSLCHINIGHMSVVLINQYLQN